MKNTGTSPVHFKKPFTGPSDKTALDKKIGGPKPENEKGASGVVSYCPERSASPLISGGGENGRKIF